MNVKENYMDDLKKYTTISLEIITHRSYSAFQHIISFTKNHLLSSTENSSNVGQFNNIAS
jgi:hypothetical protein